LPIGRHNLIRLVWLLWSKSDKNIIGGGTVLNQDFREFIQSLNDNHVRYLVIGGYAVALHGYPRYTKDIDIWIDMSPLNAASMVRALEQFGFSSLGLQAADFLVPDQIIQLGYPPGRIDLITTPPGVEFESCYASRVEVVIEDVAVNFIDLENLKKNKRASGRLQDLADLDNLE
jgi:predicted nucleotidyltransferase